MAKTLAATALFLHCLGRRYGGPGRSLHSREVSKAMGANSGEVHHDSGTAANGNSARQGDRWSACDDGDHRLHAGDTITQPFSRATGRPSRRRGGLRLRAPGTFNQGIARPRRGQMVEMGSRRGDSSKGPPPTARRCGRSASAASPTTCVLGRRSKRLLGSDYKVVGYVNDQHLIDRVETWSKHPCWGPARGGDYSNYQVSAASRSDPHRPETRRDAAFEATITDRSETPPTSRNCSRGRPRRPDAVARLAPRLPGLPLRRSAVRKNGEGGLSHHGGYVALAVEFQDHVVVSKGSERSARARGDRRSEAPLPETSPIRYVVNTHAHFDHRAGWRRSPRRGSRIVTHNNNRAFLGRRWARRARSWATPLRRRTASEGGRGTKRVSDGTQTNRASITSRNLAHSDGMLVAFLPKEKIRPPATSKSGGWTAGRPGDGDAVQTVDRLK